MEPIYDRIMIGREGEIVLHLFGFICIESCAIRSTVGDFPPRINIDVK